MRGVVETVRGYGGEVIEDHVDLFGIRRVVVRFRNGYGASIIGGGYLVESIGFGRAEGGVLAFDGDDCELVYDTPVTSDVERFDDVGEVVVFLGAIAALAARGIDGGERKGEIDGGLCGVSERWSG